MAEERTQRRLAAILAADVVGYSRLMEQDEAGTLAALKTRRREILDPLVTKHQGRVFKVTGDGALVEFASAVNAVHCAVDLQQAMAVANANQPDHQHIVLRIGINLGDIMVEGSDLYGDGINIAVRIESLAEPDEIWITASVHDQIDNKSAGLDFDDLGNREMKNMARSVHVFRVHPQSSAMRERFGGDRKPLSLPEKPSIAVLPFNNISGDPEQDYLSDGITEDIITELSRFRSLFVIARNTSFQYRGKTVDVKRVGRDLGVRFVLEGSIRRLGPRMRIATQLIDTQIGSHIWADRYDRDLHDLPALQDDVVQTVASTVSGRVEAAGRERAVRLSPVGLASYDLHLRAKASYLKITRSDNEQARLLGQRAMEIDPTNALLHAYYAIYCNMDYQLDWVEDLDGALKTSLEFARKAVALDDADSTSRQILSVVYTVMKNFADARFHIEKALELNSNDTEARSVYAWFLCCVGEPEKALEQFEIARRHNPFDLSWLPWVKGQAYFGARRYDEAIGMFSQIRATNTEANAWLAASYALAGRIIEAKRTVQEFLTLAKREMVHFPGQQPEEWAKYARRSFPYQNQSDFDHLMKGLREAGLPV
jgi:adenylate cyclase